MFNLTDFTKYFQKEQKQTDPMNSGSLKQ